MADISSTLGTVTDSLVGSTFTIVLLVVVILIILGLIGGFGYYYLVYKKKFDILIKIISRRAGEDKVYFENGAIFRDKKHNTDYLKLWNSKVELELPKFNVMHHTNKGDYLELIRESERGFRFLTPPKIDKEYIVRADGKLYPIAKLKQHQIENDLTWILERQKINKSMINPEGIMMKLLAFAPQIISMGFSFIIIWIIFRYAPQLLASMKELLKETKAQQAGTEVIGSLIPLLFMKGGFRK